MATRFYAPDLQGASGDFLLEGSEAHHLRTVCRGKVGDRVVLFDGKGLSANAEVLNIRRREIYLRLEQIQSESDWSGPQIACAMPKGDRASFLVEKCTELGVATLIPVKTERSVADPKENKLNKWERTVVEACKQCGRNHLMQIESVVEWSQLVAERKGFVLHPEGAAPTVAATQGADQIFAVGPEGGWTDEEIALAEANGWTALGLPGNILRIETAALAIAAFARLSAIETTG